MAKKMTSFAFSCLSHHRGVSGYAGTPRFPAVEAHTEHRVQSLTLDDRPNFPIPARSQAGDLAGKYGVQAPAKDFEATPLGPNPPPGDSTLGMLSNERSPGSESKRPMETPGNSTLGTLLNYRCPQSESKRPVERLSSGTPVITPG